MCLVGIMGGTFNPIHLGHIEIAHAAYKQFHLNEIWFMPNHIPTYKKEADIVSSDIRLQMVQLAIKGYKGFKASDFEIKRDGNTYTVDTLKLLNEQYPEHQFYFIMGADSLFYFDKWKDYKEIPDYSKLLIAPRDEKNVDDIISKIQFYNNYFKKECFHLINCKKIDCSSSEIRKYLNENSINNNKKYIKQYLNDNVYQYILKHQLYNFK